MVGPRVFEVEEVDRLIPRLEGIFGELDAVREGLRRSKLRINALELIWGAKIQEEDNPDHGELVAHLEDLKRGQKEVEALTQRIAEFGGQVKGLDPALVDFFGVQDSILVVWCWTRGEERIDHWHHVDEGFAGRRTIER